MRMKRKREGEGCTVGFMAKTRRKNEVALKMSNGSQFKTKPSRTKFLI